MTTYLALVFLELTAPPILLFLASEISNQRCGKRLRYPVLATLWFLSLLALAYIGYVQVSLGCTRILGECYLNGITYRFLFWKDVLGFGYLAIMLVSGIQVLLQGAKWILERLMGQAEHGSNGG